MVKNGKNGKNGKKKHKFGPDWCQYFYLRRVKKVQLFLRRHPCHYIVAPRYFLKSFVNAIDRMIQMCHYYHTEKNAI